MHIPWSKVAHLAHTIAPFILEETPLAPLAPFIADGISFAQKAHEDAVAAGQKKLTSAQKLGLAVQEVHNGIDAANAQAQREIINTEDADAAITQAISAVVAAINAKHDIQAALNKTMPEGEAVHVGSGGAVTPTAQGDGDHGTNEGADDEIKKPEA